MAAPSTQIIVLPEIPELYVDNFLDILLPAKDVNSITVGQRATTTPVAVNPVIEALEDSSRRTFTKNGAPSYNSTKSAILDAFNNLSSDTPSSDVTGFLSKSWIEDPELTLRLIWNLRSIPDGKGSKETFYRCVYYHIVLDRSVVLIYENRAFGWLYKTHPRTAISNLHLLVEPVCPPAKKHKSAKAHGCWKDLLDILCLATLDELDVSPASFLHAPRMKHVHKPRKGKKIGTPDSRIQQSKVEGQERKVAANQVRAKKLNRYHEVLVSKLSRPQFRALYIAVARLFANQLVKDIRILQKLESVKSGGDPIALIKEISLAGKWAPTPSASHDRVTNIATAISELIYASQVITPTPSALKNASLSSHERSVILRSFYQRWVLTELRQISACPEPLMASHRWTDINYYRVPSICMNNNSGHFFTHDPYGFEKYLLKVESGKGSMSGATILPHELVAQIIALKKKNDLVSASAVGGRKKGGKKKKKHFPTIPAVIEARKALAETKARVMEAQWKTLIKSLREAGTLDNCIAICDVSGSMGRITDKYDKNNVSPIFASISLSLVLASLAKPPFDAGFITFSSQPQFVKVNLNQSLEEQVTFMSCADWGQNTDFRAVFVGLLLPLAKENKIKPEDMIKRLFVFSDMQFDASREQKRKKAKSWETTYDFIKKAYAKAGYEVPQIVFWDLNGKTRAGPKTVEVESNRKGVAMMNGFSPAMLKVFMGEQEEAEEVSEWEEVMTDGTSTVTTVVEKEDEFNPINVMKKALLRKTFDGLVVVD